MEIEECAKTANFCSAGPYYSTLQVHKLNSTRVGTIAH